LKRFEANGGLWNSIQFRGQYGTAQPSYYERAAPEFGLSRAEFVHDRYKPGFRIPPGWGASFSKITKLSKTEQKMFLNGGKNRLTVV
jgi:hypothetical protein